MASKPAKKVPVVFVLDTSSNSVGSYVSAVLSTLQNLHGQLVVTHVQVGMHELTPAPFVPPATFLGALRPRLLNKKRRYSLWRSAGGVLEAIVRARSIIEAVRPPTPQTAHYIVVISATDIGNSDDLAWDTGAPEETWQDVARTFNQGPHNATLLSLISVGLTPNLEQMWREIAARFPPPFVYDSTAATRPASVVFRLYSPAHAAFFVGFSSGAGAKRASSPTATTANAKKPRPDEPTPAPASAGDLRARIEQRFGEIRQKLLANVITKEEADREVAKLKEVAQRLQRAAAPGAATAAAAATTVAPAAAPAPPPVTSTTAPATSTTVPAPPEACWHGLIMFQMGANNVSYHICCTALPMQQSTLAALAGFKLPGSLLLVGFVAIKMDAIQTQMQQHALPVLQFRAMSSESMPKPMQTKQEALVRAQMGNSGNTLPPNTDTNQLLYDKLASMIQSRGVCGVIRFGKQSNRGIIILPMPQQKKLIGIVFHKVDIPPEWFTK